MRADRVNVERAHTRWLHKKFHTEGGLTALWIIANVLVVLAIYLGCDHYIQNTSPSLVDRMDGWSSSYSSWFSLLWNKQGKNHFVFKFENIWSILDPGLGRTERVLIKDLFLSNGQAYFYENGGPVLNCKSAEFDHFKSQKKWFKDINGIEWDPSKNHRLRMREENDLQEIVIKNDEKLEPSM